MIGRRDISYLSSDLLQFFMVYSGRTGLMVCIKALEKAVRMPSLIQFTWPPHSIWPLQNISVSILEWQSHERESYGIVCLPTVLVIKCSLLWIPCVSVGRELRMMMMMDVCALCVQMLTNAPRPRPSPVANAFRPEKSVAGVQTRWVQTKPLQKEMAAFAVMCI